ncbi:MAG: hypothetical protein ACJ76S_05230 [Solirubrobacteraceae bacterium]
MAALVSIGVLLAVRVGQSKGFYGADDYSHLLISRNSVHDPSLMLAVWGRPLMTIAYIPAALIGTGAARATSIVFLSIAAVLVGLTAHRSTKRLGFMASVLLVAQPLTLMIGFSALPQMIFSLLLAAALFVRAAGRDRFAAALIGLLPLARLEGLVVVGVWALLLVRTRRLGLLPWLAGGTAGWAALGAATSGDVLWLYHQNPYGLLGSIYGAAGFRYGFISWPIAFGPIVGGLSIAAMARRQVPDASVGGITAALFAFYVAAWTLPAFRTIADPVYLVTLSVPVALCAHHGAMGIVADRDGASWWRSGAAVAFAVATGSMPLAAVTVGAITLYTVRARWAKRDLRDMSRLALATTVLAASLIAWLLTEPLPLTGAAYASARVATSLTRSQLGRVIASSHPAFDWYAGTTTYSRVDRVVNAAKGALVVWDGMFGKSDALSRLQELGYTVVQNHGRGIERVVVLERRSVAATAQHRGLCSSAGVTSACPR